SQNYQIELIRLQASAGKSSGGRDVSEIRNSYMADRPLSNPSALDDPRVAGFEQCSEIVIGEACRGKTLAPTCDHCAPRIGEFHPQSIPWRHLSSANVLNR